MHQESTQSADKQKIAELEAVVADLKRQLSTDQFMHILNRQGLMDRLESISKEVRWQHGHPDKRRNAIIKSLAILFIDVDHFKQINDQFGHAAGDEALRQLASILVDEVRTLDVVGRYGGEELVVGLVGADLADGQRVADKIRQRIESTEFRFEQHIFKFTVSIGVAELTNGDLATVLESADRALYEAKKGGRNRVVVVPIT